MKKLFKEPLVHFVLIGVGLFLLYGLVNKSESTEEIIMDGSDIQRMISLWSLQWNREPNKEELAGLMNQYVKQEVLYREALKMNLDHNDEIIKRRLTQKMEFLSQDLANLSEPSDDVLLVYFKKNSAKYMLPYEYSLYQIVFTNENHNNLEELVQQVLSESTHLSIEDMKTKGDNLPFQYYYNKVSGDAMSNILGIDFSKSLENIELNKWVGPIASGFGNHLVFLKERIDPRLPELKDIKDEVLRDYQYDRQNEVNDAIYKKFKENYAVRLDLENSDLDGDKKMFLKSALN